MLFLRLGMAAIWIAALVTAAAMSWAKARSPQDPASVLGIMPSYSDALDRSLRLDIDQQVATGVFHDSDTALRLGQVEPLADWPFVQLALLKASRGETGEAESLMLSAHRRNPRNLFAIGWLAQYDAEQGDGAGALGWLDRLIAVNPGLGEQVHAIALGYTREEGGLTGLAELLEAGRPWAKNVVGELNKSSEDLPALLELNRLARNQQDGYINRLMKEKGPEAAFIAWASLLDGGDPAAISWPFDSEFEGLDAPRPFNWTINRDLTEINAEDGLYTVYFGRGRPLFVRQVMMLHPGAYSLATEFSGETREAAGRLVWELTCLNGNVPLSRLTLDNPSGVTTTAIAEFEVPAEGCEAQQLALKGVPGDFPARVRVTTRSIRIEEVQP